ncbi:class I SAM-dependent methyltransferase [bacterium]|jgi:ubiquinone/menaquinone biosynthesis C-methylase UbiE|nr:class I SAM-dependent methyltransferase [bacterium]
MVKSKWIHKLFSEVPLYQTQWQGILLSDIAKEKGISPRKIASTDFYEAFYKKLELTNFSFDPSWKKKKKKLSNFVLQYLKPLISKNPSATILSLGAGTGIVEEDLLKAGFKIDLHETQTTSLNYLKTKNINFNEFISQDLSSFESDSYDLIMAFSISYCFSYEDYETLFKEVFRILKKGGLLIMWDPSPEIHSSKFHMLFCKIIRKLRQNTKQILLQKASHEVFWGWLRQGSLHKKLAQNAGLKVNDSFYTNDNWVKQEYSKGCFSWFILSK